MAQDTEGRLLARAAEAGLHLAPPLCEKLVVYFELLQRWNRTINLTSLTDPDEAIDRLLLEPIAAVLSLPSTPRLMDLGSGGGSPAIPLALALSVPLLVMVESRSRKAAFLREAVRELDLPAVVENARFEEITSRTEYRYQMDVVSIRAVKLDAAAFEIATDFLVSGGHLALFESVGTASGALPSKLVPHGTVPLLRNAKLTVLRRT